MCGKTVMCRVDMKHHIVPVHTEHYFLVSPPQPQPTSQGLQKGLTVLMTSQPALAQHIVHATPELHLIFDLK